jgi:flagellar hook protein FlgE
VAGEISTIQSLKAVDAWIDVINANVNGGVRTAYKTARLKFAGSNTNVDRAGTSTSLPLQFPEPSLTTANTIIDFSQGAVTASTEVTHLAVQGDGFFLLANPAMIDPNLGWTVGTNQAKLFLTRDGDFHTDSRGLLVNAAGYYLVCGRMWTSAGQTSLQYDTNFRFGANSGIRPIFNDLELPVNASTPQRAMKLSEYVNQALTLDFAGQNLTANMSVIRVAGGKQNLRYTQLGSTVFDFGFKAVADYTTTLNFDPAFTLAPDSATVTPGNQTSFATILTKSLEASNASMTQSVPELSLAQKLFSALTKVLQTKQTNVDGVLNLVR